MTDYYERLALYEDVENERKAIQRRAAQRLGKRLTVIGIATVVIGCGAEIDSPIEAPERPPVEDAMMTQAPEPSPSPSSLSSQEPPTEDEVRALTADSSCEFVELKSDQLTENVEDVIDNAATEVITELDPSEYENSVAYPGRLITSVKSAAKRELGIESSDPEGAYYRSYTNATTFEERFAIVSEFAKEEYSATILIGEEATEGEYPAHEERQIEPVTDEEVKHDLLRLFASVLRNSSPQFANSAAELRGRNIDVRIVESIVRKNPEENLINTSAGLAVSATNTIYLTREALESEEAAEIWEHEVQHHHDYGNGCYGENDLQYMAIDNHILPYDERRDLYFSDDPHPDVVDEIVVSDYSLYSVMEDKAELLALQLHRHNVIEDITQYPVLEQKQDLLISRLSTYSESAANEIIYDQHFSDIVIRSIIEGNDKFKELEELVPID